MIARGVAGKKEKADGQRLTHDQPLDIAPGFTCARERCRESSPPYTMRLRAWNRSPVDKL
jgi:hypothetical protein